jgi:hypothetical protein
MVLQFESESVQIVSFTSGVVGEAHSAEMTGAKAASPVHLAWNGKRGRQQVLAIV